MMGLVHSPVPPKKELPPPFAPEEGFALKEFGFEIVTVNVHVVV